MDSLDSFERSMEKNEDVIMEEKSKERKEGEKCIYTKFHRKIRLN